MSEKRPVVIEGYQPELLKKGYQPTEFLPLNRPEPGAGYQPTSQGDNPSNPPTPPKGR